jgi:Zn-dependent peptidase ImmA (M78 family)/transcriptional regulator with XRE-family HTH domain
MIYIGAGAEKSTPARAIPSRIKEAREARGFTLESFADALGVTKSAVGQYENGQIGPSGEVMDAIIRLTRQPPAFFTTPRDEEAQVTPFWRSLKRMQLHNRNRISRRMIWASDVVRYLERFIELPKPNIPSVEFDHETAELDDIESVANSVRDHWGLGRGPIQDLMGVIEVNGITVLEEDVECEDMDAVSGWVRGRPFILMGDPGVPGPRKNFNLAHELGHLVLHASATLDAKTLDRIEAQANRFASAFLMPQESFSSDVLGTSLSYLATLKRRWNVAIAAIGYRAKDLGIMDKHQYGYLIRQMNIKNIRKHEPYDNEVRVSKPAILPHAIRMLVENRVQSKGQILSSIGFNGGDLESICGLPAGFLQDNVIDLKSAISLRSK